MLRSTQCTKCSGFQPLPQRNYSLTKASTAWGWWVAWTLTVSSLLSRPFAVQAGPLLVMLCHKQQNTIWLLRATSVNTGAAHNGKVKLAMKLSQLVIYLRKRIYKWSLKGLGITIKQSSMTLPMPKLIRTSSWSKKSLRIVAPLFVGVTKTIYSTWWWIIWSQGRGLQPWRGLCHVRPTDNPKGYDCQICQCPWFQLGKLWGESEGSPFQHWWFQTFWPC